MYIIDASDKYNTTVTKAMQVFIIPEKKNCTPQRCPFFSKPILRIVYIVMLCYLKTGNTSQIKRPKQKCLIFSKLYVIV